MLLAEDRGEAGDQLVHEGGELGDVGLVSGIGVGDERDPAVHRHDEPEATDAQVIALLLRMSPLRDRGTLIARVDPGGKVRHVEHETRQVDREGLDHRGDDAALDLFQLVLAERVHRLPEAPVIEHAR